MEDLQVRSELASRGVRDTYMHTPAFIDPIIGTAPSQQTGLGSEPFACLVACVSLIHSFNQSTKTPNARMCWRM